MINHLALGARAALAGTLASEVRGAGKVVGAFAVTLAFMTATGQGRPSVTRKATAHWHLVHYLAFSVLPAWAGLARGL